MKHLPSLILCLLLLACGGESFSVDARLTGGTASLASSGGADGEPGGTDAAGGADDGPGAASTGGTHHPSSGGTAAQGGSSAAGSVGVGGAGGTDDVPWIPDAECGPPLIDYSKLPTHFVWDSFSASAGGECLYCLQSPCVEFEAVWDETFSKWTLWDESWGKGYAGGGSLELRALSTTRIGEGGDTIQLGRSATCGDDTPTDYCNCTVSFGSDYNTTNNMFLVRSATGWVPDNSVFLGMAPESCGGDFGCSAMTPERMELNNTAGTEMATVLSAESDGLEFPCSGN
jgi:hypothetical protein